MRTASSSLETTAQPSITKSDAPVGIRDAPSGFPLFFWTGPFLSADVSSASEGFCKDAPSGFPLFFWTVPFLSADVSSASEGFCNFLSCECFSGTFRSVKLYSRDAPAGGALLMRSV